MSSAFLIHPLQENRSSGLANDRLCLVVEFETARGYHIERKNYIADVLGEKPLPPDKGPHTKPVMPVKVTDNLCVSSTFSDDISYSDLTSRKRHRRSSPRESGCKQGAYVKPGEVEKPRAITLKHKSNSTSVSESKNVQLSWRNRNPENQIDSEFQSFGRHRPRESADERWINFSSSRKKTDNRPSSNSSKFIFDYRYDY